MIFSKSLDHWTAGKYVLAVGLFLVSCATPLFAQQSRQLTRPKVEAKAIFGGAVFGSAADVNCLFGSSMD